MVLAALRLADCLLTAESSLLDPHPFLPMQLPALQLPLAGQSKDRDSSLTGLIGPGYPATYRFKALSLATACLLTALAAASFLATGLLACS